MNTVFIKMYILYNTLFHRNVLEMKGISATGWTHHYGQCPRQSDMHSCGIFTLMVRCFAVVNQLFKNNILLTLMHNMVEEFENDNKYIVSLSLEHCLSVVNFYSYRIIIINIVLLLHIR